MQIAKFKIEGMDCAEEVNILRSQLAPLPGVKDLAFDVLNGKLTVVFEEPAVDTARLVAAINATGMRGQQWQDDKTPNQLSGSGRTLRSALTAASGVLLLAAFLIDGSQRGFWEAFTDEGDVSRLAATACVLSAICGVWIVLPKAVKSLRRIRPDMNLLMVTAVAGAFCIQQYFEGATVAFLFAVSLALESWSIGRARRAIAALMSITPDTANVLNSNGAESTLAVGSVAIGSTVVVRPGEKFPLDGSIVKGTTTVNQAPITGESMPVSKSPGSEVFAGTINQDGAVEFATTKAAGDTTLARIARLVDDAQSKRSPSEQWVEQFARYYTPCVMILAIAVMLLPPLIVDGSWSHWFYEGLVLLVIACPCALVISTPVSIVSALAASARQGVIVKGGIWMEAAAKLRAIAMDKTGTLTEGHPSVQAVMPMSGHSEDDFLEIAAALELRSEHPLAKAIVKAAAARGLRPLPADEFQAEKGKGATARVKGRLIWIGSHRLLEERGQETPDMHERLVRIEEQGSSIVVVGEDHHVCGFIAISDGIRPQAKEALLELRRAGIEHIAMLTGDNRGTAEAVGQETGVDSIRAELLPEDKVTVLDELVERYGQVAMIGDGVNDAPAMARATMGIAMGAVGSDAALETADVALMNDDLSKLPWLIRHSKRTLAIIRQNIFMALGVKALFVLLTLSGHASLWAAIAADTGTSLVVIANGLRLIRPAR